MKMPCLLLIAMLLFPTLASAAPGGSTPPLPRQFNNPVWGEGLADPFCFYHQGVYYAIGTGRGRKGAQRQAGMEVPMVKSRDLQHWEYVGLVLEPAPEERGKNFWAPEIAYADGTFYLYYHADGNGKGFRIRVATSQNPEGPYRDTAAPLTDVAQIPFAIDSHAFRDDDGQWYMFYATDFLDFNEKTFRGTALAVDRMISMTHLEGKPQPVMRAHWQWQVYQRNRNMAGKVADWFTLEGPAVIKRNGKYYCFYSGGCYQNDSYGVDYLVADSIMGPWREVGRERGPQIMRSVPDKVIGPGHNSIVSSPDGKQDYIVYHAWNKAMSDRLMCVDPIVWTKEGPKVERFTERIREMNAQAGQGADSRPTLFTIGDSTVKNGSGKGEGALWGWGDKIAPLFDTTKINVANRALGGRSSRTFITEGLWDKIAASLKPGDFVIMQFGHNDGGELARGTRPRASLKGNGEETRNVVVEMTGKAETVHSYGWYLRQIIADTKAKGATAIVCSPIPRNIWKDGKVGRAANDYGKWAQEAAQAGGAEFINLNAIIADQYDKNGEQKAKEFFTPADHTHTNLAGAKLNAAAVAEGINALKDCPLLPYLAPDKK